MPVTWRGGRAASECRYPPTGTVLRDNALTGQDQSMSENEHTPGFETLAVRAGQRRTAEQEHAEPIFPTSSYVFESAAEAGLLVPEKFVSPNLDVCAMALLEVPD